MKAIKRKRRVLITLMGGLAVMFLGVQSTAWAQDSDAKPPTVKASKSDSLGKFLTDGQGRALYFFSADSRRASNCHGFCAQAYPPYTADGRLVAGDGALTALLGTLKRKDGTTQVTYSGHPLYYYGGDIRAGSIAGASKRYGGEWFAIAPGGKIAEAKVKTSDDEATAKQKTTAGADDEASENPFEGDPEAVAAGEKLYQKVGCYGCHGRSGGGGMGPSLVDSKWRYGDSDADLFESIVQGRPKGMPAWGSHFTDDQVWQIVSYIRSLSN